LRVLIVTVQIPFVRGGAENLAEGLQDAFVAAGHQSEIVALPFKWYPPGKILDQMLASRLIDLSEFSGERVDAIIGLKFPAYLAPHPQKKIWLLHQHRIEKWLVVDREYRCTGLITVKDIQKRLDYPHATKDDGGRLRVAAAVGVGPDTLDRVAARLIEHETLEGPELEELLGAGARLAVQQ